MNNRRFVSSWMLALLLPVTLGAACVRRDWNICAPDDKQPCLPGYVCTPDLLCVRATDGGSDGLVNIDSRGPTDGAGTSVDVALSAGNDGPAIARPDAAGPTVDSPFDVPVSTVPDAPAAGGPPDAPTASGPPDAPVAVADAPVVDAPSSGPTVDASSTCTADKDCAGRPGTPACAASGMCVACTQNQHCTGVAGTCDTSTNQCVGCLKRSDCGGVCQACTKGVCTSLKSQDDPGVCAGTCDSTGACKSKQGQTCQTAGGGCAAGTTCSPDGVCCDSACDQACRSCLGSKTGGADGTCANMTNGASCGGTGGQYCNAGTCGIGCLIGGTLYTNGAVSSTNPCQTCQASVSSTSWSPLGNGTGCGSGQVCSGGNCQTGCWISGSFVGSGATNASNICQICNPVKSTTGWSNNDAATAVQCGGCGGTAACSNGALGACSKDLATYYQDADGDGYGNPNIQPVLACTAPTGWVAQAGDCDDTDAQDHPGSTECENSDPNTLTTCSSSGSLVSSTCPNGCAGGQCRTFPFPTVSVGGLVTCGTLQCPTSQGCSFGGGWSGQAVCGSPVKYYHAMCDGPNDCPSGQVCCWILSGGSDGGIACFPSGTCPSFQMGSNAYLVCDPNQAASCPPGSTCTMMLSPYSSYICQPN
jgi:hypothetical protein